MRDFRKFCRPKIKNTSSVGDIILKLKCGTTGTISQEEYNKVKQFFKLESFVGESTSSPGKIKAESKLLGEEAIFDIATYQIIEDSFEIKEIVGDKKTPADGDIICHNSILNRDATFSFLDWLNVDDSWEITGLYNIETFEEEDTVGGEYVILANGTTLIIKAEDYSKVSSNWEKVDEIPMSGYNFLDILYSDAQGNKKVSSEILPASEGYTPIGICVAKTGFFGKNEPARFMSLKYMNYTTPETGSLTAQNMYWGNYKTDLNMIPNIQATHNGGNDYGYFTVDYYDSSSQANKIPSMFNENNKWNTSILGAVNQYSTTDIQGREKTDLILASATSQSTWMTDISITNESGAGYAPAACCCARYHTIGTEAGDWYLGASGEMCMIIVQKTAINAKLAQIAAVYASDSISSLANVTYWSSTEYSSNLTYYVNANSGYISYYNKSNNYNVVAMLQY